jgi:RNA polymerase sigma-70 factor, ECF subfamily
MNTLLEPSPTDLSRDLSFATLLSARTGNAFGCIKHVAISNPQRRAASIVAIATAKDRAAFSRLFEHFAPRLKSYYQRSGLKPSVAEDLAQEVMIAIWQKAHQYDPSRATAAAWIFGIAANLRIDHLRRRRVALPIDDPLNQLGPAALPDAKTEADAAGRRMRDASADLPGDQKSALHLAFFEDRSHAEIQSMLGLPLGTIKSQLRLALGKLSTALKDCA